VLTRLTPRFPQPTGDADENHRQLCAALADWFRRLNERDSLAIAETVDWTPTLIGLSTAGTQTYDATTQGRATRIERLVFLHDCRVTLTAKGGTMAGSVAIGGLPFTTKDTGTNTGSISIGGYDAVNLSAGYAQLGIIVPPNATQLYLYESGDNVSAQQVAAGSIANTTSITFSGVYELE
jgi:hypothetical protein